MTMNSDIIILALPGPIVIKFSKENIQQLEGKIVIDLSNEQRNGRRL